MSEVKLEIKDENKITKKYKIEEKQIKLNSLNLPSSVQLEPISDTKRMKIFIKNMKIKLFWTCFNLFLIWTGCILINIYEDVGIYSKIFLILGSIYATFNQIKDITLSYIKDSKGIGKYQYLFPDFCCFKIILNCLLKINGEINLDDEDGFKDQITARRADNGEPFQMPETFNSGRYVSPILKINQRVEIKN